MVHNWTEKQIEWTWAVIPEFPHKSITEDLLSIPVLDVLPRWLEVYNATKETREAAIETFKSGGDWEAIRLAIEPFAKEFDTELYRQVIFRSLGTQEEIINRSSINILKEHIYSVKFWSDKFEFFPRQEDAIFKIFDRAGESKLFEYWRRCRKNLVFCESSLPFPANRKYRLDPVKKMCNPIIGIRSGQALPKRFDKQRSEKFMDELCIYRHRFRLFDTWETLKKAVESKVDPTGMRLTEAYSPFFNRYCSDKKAASLTRKVEKAEALKFGIDYKPVDVIIAQCFYCYQLRVESPPSGNGVIHRYCSNCGELEREFWKIWKK
jgi:hypothetical protein